MTSSQTDASVLPFAQSSAPPDVLRTMLQQLEQDVITAEFSEDRVHLDYIRPGGRRFRRHLAMDPLPTRR